MGSYSTHVVCSKGPQHPAAARHTIFIRPWLAAALSGLITLIPTQGLSKGGDHPWGVCILLRRIEECAPFRPEVAYPKFRALPPARPLLAGWAGQICCPSVLQPDTA